MHVDTRLLRYLEEFGWDYLPICHDDEVVTVKLTNIVQELLIPTDLHRLVDRSMMCECELLNRTRLHDLISSEGFVRIGHDEGDVEPTIGIEICEDCRGQRWSTEESDTNHSYLLL